MRLGLCFLTLNYNRAIKIPEANEFVTDELNEFYNLVVKRTGDVLKPERDAKAEELNHYDALSKGGMIEDVSMSPEEEMTHEFQDIVDERANVETIVKDLKVLMKKHHREDDDDDNGEPLCGRKRFRTLFILRHQTST